MAPLPALAAGPEVGASQASPEFHPDHRITPVEIAALRCPDIHSLLPDAARIRMGQAGRRDRHREQRANDMSRKPPEKPSFGSPCNGCGLCCAAQICQPGSTALGLKDADDGDHPPGPCPLMRWHDGRFWCGLLETERAPGTILTLVTALGIGSGCQVDGASDEDLRLALSRLPEIAD
jgi:hypothetical protein